MPEIPPEVLRKALRSMASKAPGIDGRTAKPHSNMSLFWLRELGDMLRRALQTNTLPQALSCSGGSIA